MCEIFGVLYIVWQGRPFVVVRLPFQSLLLLCSRKYILSLCSSCLVFVYCRCENCKFMAPTMLQIEEEYKDKVNFVMVNGDDPQSWPLIEAFGVDAIPHMALINAEGEVETALIGPIPKRVLEADLNVLLANAALLDDDSSSKADGLAIEAVIKERDTEMVAARALKKQDLPYKMLAVFANQPELRRVQFVTSSDD